MAGLFLIAVPAELPVVRVRLPAVTDNARAAAMQAPVDLVVRVALREYVARCIRRVPALRPAALVDDPVVRVALAGVPASVLHARAALVRAPG